MMPEIPPNTMTPSSLQLPPNSRGVSHTVSTPPLPTSMRRREPASEKATNRLSGDQNTVKPEVSAPASSRACPLSREWTHSRASRPSSDSR